MSHLSLSYSVCEEYVSGSANVESLPIHPLPHSQSLLAWLSSVGLDPVPLLLPLHYREVSPSWSEMCLLQEEKHLYTVGYTG